MRRLFIALRSTAAVCLLAAGTALLMPAGTASAQATAPAPAEYRLGSGDVIRITVFQNPELTLETRVTEGGLVSYPLLGSIRAWASRRLKS